MGKTGDHCGGPRFDEVSSDSLCPFQHLLAFQMELSSRSGIETATAHEPRRSERVPKPVPTFSRLLTDPTHLNPLPTLGRGKSFALALTALSPLSPSTRYVLWCPLSAFQSASLAFLRRVAGSAVNESRRSSAVQLMKTQKSTCFAW